MYRDEYYRVFREGRPLVDSVIWPYRYGVLYNCNGSLLLLVQACEREVSLVAMVFSLVGCTIRLLGPLRLVPFHVHSQVFFGFYCLLIGYLILRSTFLPHALGALMAIAGLGVLTFVSRATRKSVLSLSLHSRWNWRGTADRVASCSRRERCTVEGAGRRAKRYADRGQVTGDANAARRVLKPVLNAISRHRPRYIRSKRQDTPAVAAKWPAGRVECASRFSLPL
jgi:Domain of unknown function (DUF4386)